MSYAAVTSTLTPILLIDNDFHALAAMEAYLRASLPACELLRVSDVKAIKSALVSHDWQLVLCHDALSTLSLNDVLEIVQDQVATLPVIVCADRYDETQALMSLQIGGRDYITCCNLPLALRVVQRELQHSQLLRTLIRVEHSKNHLLHYDDLTGLPNRHLFCQWVDQCLSSTASFNIHRPTLIHGVEREAPLRQAAVLYLDIDRFMRVNDTYGHAVGDQFLQLVALRLKETVGDYPLARVGEDKFAIFLNAMADEQEIAHCVQKIHQRFESPCVIDRYEFFFTFSVGASVRLKSEQRALNLLKEAESAMFLAKRSEQQGVQFFKQEDLAVISRRVIVETALRHALVRGELSLCYQPIIDTSSRHFTGVEALLRWHQHELGVISPDEFIPIADESGFIIEIGNWVMLTACQQAKAWHDMGFQHLSMAINFSASQFRHPDLVQHVKEVIQITGINPETIEIEITETVAMQDAPSTIEKLKALKALGIRISIDDFGTGYSSLAYLKRFPIDIIKIDKAFVRDVNHDADNAAIVRAVAALARSLRLSLLAEGVENLQQLEFLNLIGCDRIQGYYFSKPQSSDVVTGLIVEHHPSPVYQQAQLLDAMTRLGLTTTANSEVAASPVKRALG